MPLCSPVCEPAGDLTAGLVDAMCVHIKMCDGAQSRLVFDADSDALLGESFRKRLRGSPGFGNIYEDEVGLDGIGQAKALDLSQTLCESTRVVVIFGQPCHVMIERVQACRRQYSGLAHGATEAQFPVARGPNELFAAREDRSDRASKPLRELEPQPVKGRSELSRRRAGCGHAGPPPRTTHVR